MDLEPNELLALAREEFEQQQLEKSLLKIKTLLAEHHPPAGTLELAARVYARLRLYERAIALLHQVLEQDPASLERRIELAMVQQDSGDRESALLQWEDLLQQHPLMPPALFNAAWLRSVPSWLKRIATSMSCSKPCPKTTCTPSADGN